MSIAGSATRRRDLGVLLYRDAFAPSTRVVSGGFFFDFEAVRTE